MTLRIIEQEDMHRQIIEYSFETTIIHSNHEILYINQSGADFLKSDKESIIGANIVEVFTDEYKDYIVERIRQGSEENIIGDLIETTIYKMDGTTVDVELYCHPILFGETKAIQSIVRDITSRRHVEKKLKNVLNEISTVVVPISAGIAVFPMVGEVDGERVIQLLEILPQKIHEHNYQSVIIDLSGIYSMDEAVVDFLYKINALMNLMGVMAIFTGIRPELAQSAVSICKGVTSLQTFSTVQQALSRLLA